MGKQKFLCKKCGVIVIGGRARREHCQIHHPTTQFGKLDVFFPIDFCEYDSESKIESHIPSISIGTTIKKDTEKGVSYISDVEMSKNSSFDCLCTIPIDCTCRPKSSRIEDLFEFAVKTVAKINAGKPSVLEAKMSRQWMNICFGYPELKTYEREEYMALIKDAYRSYFKRGQGNKYSFDFEQIVRDFPHFFKKGAPVIDKNISYKSLINDVKTEINLSQSPHNRLRYRVDKIERIDRAKFLYQFHLDLGDDDIPSFYEGISVKLKVGEVFYDCEGIDYDTTNELLVVRSQRTIFGTKGTIYLDTTFILKALCERLNELSQQGFTDNQPGAKFIPDKTAELSAIANASVSYLPIIKQMDKSQMTAHDAAVKNDITFIWGPPGTGKSYTMAALINTLFRNNSSTLVCCISNVAVDQLLNKVIDVVESLNILPKQGQLLRSGHTIDSRLMKKDYLFPSDLDTKRIRNKIAELSIKIASPKYSADQKTIFKENRLDLREELKVRTETLISKSVIVFSTIANYILSGHFRDKQFDNLIVDEASMLSLPYLMAIALKISKRIILVGDPNQLGPIALSTRKSLTENVFDYCKVLESDNHPALHQLLTQRRSHRLIVELTNSTFYGGRLQSVITDSPQWVIEGPFPKKVVKTINEDIEDDATQMCGTSRRNFGTFSKVLQILEEYYRYCEATDEKISIGIISPYRAQIKMYYARIRQIYGHSNFFNYIKIGTIHTFQGSECDLIIFDLVEKAPTQVSRLMKRQDGERLITVALSRAKHKLIVVGDTKRFKYSIGTNLVSNNVCQILCRL